MVRSSFSRVSLFFLLLALPVLVTSYVAAQPQPVSTAAPITAAANRRIMLPAVTDKGPVVQSVFGVEVTRGGARSAAGRTSEANLAWTRYNGIVWSEIEPNRGAPDFSKLGLIDADLQVLADKGVRPILVVRGTPAWAQQVPGWSCGAIRADARADFARFMRQIVARYSAAPYYIQHYEIGNEIDVAPDQVGQDSPFGCWGNRNDPNFGGGDYGEMLKVVYPAIKEASPTAQLMLGGLLLDCDPTVPGRAEECKAGNFLAGVLQSGAGASFDILAYHGYTFWDNSLANNDWDLNSRDWGHRGGQVLGKLNFLREVMNRYGVNKPVMMNEGGLLCSPYMPGPCNPSVFQAMQANYAVRLYTRTWANNMLASIWYTLDYPGWHEGALLNADGSERPAYSALRFMGRRLAGGEFVRTLAFDRGGLEGYEFRNGTKTYQVYWTNNGSNTPVSLPSNAIVYNMKGERVTYSGFVGFEPIFVETGS